MCSFSPFQQRILRLSLGCVMVVTPWTVYGDIFAPPSHNNSEVSVQAGLSLEDQQRLEQTYQRLDYLEERLMSVDRLEREMREQAQRQAEQAKRQNDSSKKEHQTAQAKYNELPLVKRVQIDEYLENAYTDMGRVNGGHLIKYKGQTRLMGPAQYVAFKKEQQTLAIDALNKGVIDELTQSMQKEVLQNEEKNLPNPNIKFANERSAQDEELARVREQLEKARESKEREREARRDADYSSSGNDYRAMRSSSRD